MTRTVPLLLLALLTALQVLPTLFSRDLWAYDEVRHASVLHHMREDGDWLALRLNGEPYPDKPPLYFWYASGFATLLGTDATPAWFLASGVAGFLFLLATWALARRTLLPEAGAALWAPVLVMVTPLFHVLLRTTRMDLLFGAAIVCAWTFLGRGLRQDDANRYVTLGLLAGGIATLVKGPFGILFPAAAMFAYLGWQGRWRRMLRRDVFLGLLAVLGLLAAWALGVALVGGREYLDTILGDQVVGRAVGASKHTQPFWFYVPVLFAAFFPWSLAVLALPVGAISRCARWQAWWLCRRDDPDGRTWLVVCALSAFLVLSLVSGKLFIYVLPVFAPLAILVADGLRRMTAERIQRFLFAVGIAALLLGAALPWANRWHTLPLQIEGLFVTGALLAATGLAVLLLRTAGRYRPLAALVGGGSAVLLFTALVVIPSLDPVMSPRGQAEKIATFVERGYAPLVFETYPGAYTYYAGRVLPESYDLEVLERHLQRPGALLVSTSEGRLRGHPDLLGDLRMRVVHRQHVEGSPQVLLVRDPEEQDERSPR